MGAVVGSPHDIAIGRMAQDRGWVDPAALRSVYASLPPQLSLAEALQQRGLLQPGQVQALLQELGLQSAPPPGTAHWSPPSPASAQTLPIAPPGANHSPADSNQTLHLSPPGHPASGRYAQPPSDSSHTLPLPGPGSAVTFVGGAQDGTATLPPGAPGPAQSGYQSGYPGVHQSGSGSSMDAATLMGGPPANLSNSGSSAGALPEPGSVLAGRYEILRVLGQGGMGAVYLANDRQRSAQVALKVMLPGAAGEQALIRFQREAEALAKVDDHIGIVRIRDYGSEGGLPYAALDLIEGGDLHDRIKSEGPLPVEEAVRLTAEVARAIHHCHERSILHRDLKPANVMVRTADGAPFVTDFGLAYDAEDATERLTQTGQVMGTPAYMPPEQAEGDKEHIDERSDVYGLGAILYELLAGEAPFRGEGMAIIKKVLLDEPRDLHERRAEVPLDLARIQQKAMAKDPELRYASAADFASDLERLQRGEPILARPPTHAERMRWRRQQGDKRAIASYVGLRFLLPIGLVLGLALAGFQIRPWERFQVGSQFSEGIPKVLAEPIVYPGKKRAGDLKHEATQLVNSLAAIHGVEVENMERPNLALWELISRPELAEHPRIDLLRAYALRLDVALGDRPQEPASELDPEGATLDLLREVGFGKGPPLETASPLGSLPEGAPESASSLLKTLGRVETRLRSHEEQGWRDALGSKPDAWGTKKLLERLQARLKPLGGSGAWTQFLELRQREIKREAALRQVQAVADQVRGGRANRIRIINTCQRALDRLEDEPAVSARALAPAFSSLGDAALVAMHAEDTSDVNRSQHVVEVFSDPQVGKFVDWEQAAARLKASGEESAADNLARTYVQTGQMPTSVLVLCLRLGTRHKSFIEGRPDHYAAELKQLIRSRSGGASAAAFLLYGDAQNFRARRTEVDRDNPEIILQTCSSYASALGPASLPVPAGLHELKVETPSLPLSDRWASYAEARLFTLLSDYEHYVNVGRRAGSEERQSRMRTLLSSGLTWFEKRGALAPLGEQVNVMNALSRLSREASLFLSAQDYDGLKHRVVACLDQVIEALLTLSERFGGKSARVKVAISELDQGVGPDHLQRNLCGLLEGYYSALQSDDYERCIKRVREVHARYQANMGGPSPKIYKASVQLSLGMGKLTDAKVEVEGLLAFYAKLSSGSGSATFEDLAERVDGAEAWLAQVYAMGKDLKRAREIREAALAKGGGKHDHWTKILPLLREE
jgi:protein kinase-like protein